MFYPSPPTWSKTWKVLLTEDLLTSRPGIERPGRGPRNRKALLTEDLLSSADASRNDRPGGHRSTAAWGRGPASPCPPPARCVVCCRSWLLVPCPLCWRGPPPGLGAPLPGVPPAALLVFGALFPARFVPARRSCPLPPASDRCRRCPCKVEEGGPRPPTFYRRGIIANHAKKGPPQQRSLSVCHFPARFGKSLFANGFSKLKLEPCPCFRSCLVHTGGRGFFAPAACPFWFVSFTCA